MRGGWNRKDKKGRCSQAGQTGTKAAMGQRVCCGQEDTSKSDGPLKLCTWSRWDKG